MSRSTRAGGGVLLAATILIAAFGAAAPAAAIPEPQPTRAPVVLDYTKCLLERVGSQYVRCDDLTGMGAAAPAWIHEQ